MPFRRFHCWSAYILGETHITKREDSVKIGFNVLVSLFAFLCTSLAATAQYYILPNYHPGENPGGLNSNTEAPAGQGLPGGWQNILGSASGADGLSSAQNIPFAFSFNGESVNSFKASNAGFITFTSDLQFGVVPGLRTLPSAEIPDNSICILGLNGAGPMADFSGIHVKTFGVAPNRQHWIQFNTFSLGETYTFWAIVLEETTNRIYVVDQRTSADATEGVVVGIQIDAQTAIAVNEGQAIQARAHDVGTDEDNMYYEFVFGTQPANASLGMKLDSPHFPSITSTPLPLMYTVRNMGSETVTELVASVFVDDELLQSQTFSNLSLTTGQQGHIMFGTPLSVSTPGDYNVELRIDQVNGAPNEQESSGELQTEVVVSPTRIDLTSELLEGYGDSIIATASHGLDDPKDLAFHPDGQRMELWVVNQKTETSGGTTTTFFDAGSNDMTSTTLKDGNAWHFMSLPTSISFSENGNFATASGVFSANHNSTPFTGPTLWSSDLDIYAQPSGQNGSHLDMLHVSPYAQGIEYEQGNVFWVFDGYTGDIVRYDFAADHGAGNSLHEDGRARRFSVPVARIDEEVPCHMVLDSDKKWLYIADAGNNRVLRLDITSGAVSADIPAFPAYEPMAEYVVMENIVWEEVEISGVLTPAGIDLIGNHLYVGDYQTGFISVFDISGDTPERIGTLRTQGEGLCGIAIGPQGRVWYTNGQQNIVGVVRPGAPVSVDNANATAVMSVYPNPANNHMTLHIDDSHFTHGESMIARVIDVSGRTVTTIPVNTSRQLLQTTNLAPGMYTLQVYSQQKLIANKPFVVQR